MPQVEKLAKAQLIEIDLNSGEEGSHSESAPRKVVTVQFNPQTLKLSSSNQRVGGGQHGGAASQYVGRATTTLSMELLFDVTSFTEQNAIIETNDVRQLTSEVAYFITPRDVGLKNQGKTEYVPPGVRFSWGSFLFDGVMDSMNETLELFSADGRPLRASVSITLSKQEIQFNRNSINVGVGSGKAVGVQPQNAAFQGDSIQGMASRSGRLGDWKQIAAANNIEDPRRLSPGTLIDLNK